MTLKFYKYHGAGNDFLVADDRKEGIVLSPEQVVHLCDRHVGFGADGVILLKESSTKAFSMEFYNPDGSSGMMCGNGGRCIVAFAADLGIVSGHERIEFEAPDGLHEAEFIGGGEEAFSTREVRLKMVDVHGVEPYPEQHTCFIDTGTRHVVKFVERLKDYPVESEGKMLRHSSLYAPLGANVNFVEPKKTDEGLLLQVRTYEKGVEGETLACGTGIVASAIVANSQGLRGRALPDGRVSYRVKVAIAELTVEFRPEGYGKDYTATDIWLTGPAAFIGTVEISL